MPDRIIHWEEPHTIHTYEVDFANRLRVSAVFNLMQEAAANSADHLGFGYEDFQDKGIFWVLSRMKLVVHEVRELGDNIVTETWPRGIDGLFAMRDFRMKDADTGKVFCSATSSWLILDAQSGRPRKPSDYFTDPTVWDPKGALEEKAPKIEEAKDKSPLFKKTIRYMDLDVNRHVNHVKYIEYILDCFPLEQYLENHIASMQLNFSHESRYGDMLQLNQAALAENEYYLDGINEQGKTVFQAIMQWRKNDSSALPGYNNSQRSLYLY